MRIQQLNIECLRLINLAGGREVPIDDFHFMPLQAAQLTLKYNGNDEHAIKQHIETLRASLTAANVAECVECKPLFMYEISARKGQPRYRVIMELLDEANDRALRDVAFCRVPVETGNHGYKVTGLFKEAGIVPVAIIEKI